MTIHRLPDPEKDSSSEPAPTSEEVLDIMRHPGEPWMSSSALHFILRRILDKLGQPLVTWNGVTTGPQAHAVFQEIFSLMYHAQTRAGEVAEADLHKRLVLALIGAKRVMARWKLELDKALRSSQHLQIAWKFTDKDLRTSQDFCWAAYAEFGKELGGICDELELLHKHPELAKVTAIVTKSPDAADQSPPPIAAVEVQALAPTTSGDADWSPPLSRTKIRNATGISRSRQEDTLKAWGAEEVAGLIRLDYTKTGTTIRTQIERFLRDEQAKKPKKK